MPVEQRSVEGFRTAAAAFTEAGKAARDAGLKLLFHNHGHDFNEVDGTVLYDILLDVDPELLGFELDLYWAVDGGHDPAKLFQEHPGRFPALHVKDMAADGSWEDVGAGKLDFAAMFEHAAAAASSSTWSSMTSRPSPGPRRERSYRSLVDSGTSYR